MTLIGYFDLEKYIYSRSCHRWVFLRINSKISVDGLALMDTDALADTTLIMPPIYINIYTHISASLSDNKRNISCTPYTVPYVVELILWGLLNVNCMGLSWQYYEFNVAHGYNKNLWGTKPTCISLSNCPLKIVLFCKLRYYIAMFFVNIKDKNVLKKSIGQFQNHEPLLLRPVYFRRTQFTPLPLMSRLLVSPSH